MVLDGGNRPGNRLNVSFVVFAVLIIVSFGALGFSTRNFEADFQNLGLTAFSGIRRVIHGVSSFASRTVLSVGELTKLRREYNELTERIARYEQLERSAAEIRQENNRLREQLGFSQSLRYRHIPAELIGRDPDNLFSAFVINKGSRAGVAVNMPVIAYQDGIQGLVGKVIETSLFESLVMPLYDSSSFVSTRLSESRYEGIAEGQGQAETPLLMRFIQKRARDEISIGDMVISSGIGGVFPPDINVGRVGGIHYDENEISMELELECAVNFSRLEYVFAIDARDAARDAGQNPPAAASAAEGSLK